MPLHPQANVRPQTAQVHLPSYTSSPPRWAAGVAPIMPLSARAQQARAVGFTRSPTSTGGGRLLTRKVQSARPRKSERCFSPGSPTRVVTPLSTPPGPSSYLALPRTGIVAERTRDLLYKTASGLKACQTCGHRPVPAGDGLAATRPTQAADGSSGVQTGAQRTVIGARRHSAPDVEHQHKDPGKYHSLGDKALDLEKRLQHELCKSAQLQSLCDRQSAHLRQAKQETEMLGAKLAHLVDMDTELRRNDVSLEHFFTHAARRSSSARTRKGFLALGDQLLSHGGTALPSTSQITIDALQALQRTQRPAHARAHHGENGVESFNRPFLDRGVPVPRFWGNPRVKDYDLERLRKGIAEMGLDTTTSPEFPRTDKELLNEAAHDEITEERKGMHAFWKHAKEMAVQVQHISTKATRAEVLEAFEKMIPGRVPGTHCIVYSVEREFLPKLKEVSFWSTRKKQTVVLPNGAGIPGAVLNSQRTILIQDVQTHKTLLPAHEQSLDYPRESAIASPCYNEYGDIAFILEVTSTMTRIHYTLFDRMLLEFAGTLLMPFISRSRLAEECLETIAVRDRVLYCARSLAETCFIQNIDVMAENCRECVHGESARVWLLDKRNDVIFVNTDDESKAEIASVTNGALGACVLSQMSTVTFTAGYLDEDPISFACVPILDRTGSCLGVLEMGQKRNSVSGLLERFSGQDELMMHAFAVLLANYIEHSQFVFSLRNMSAGMEHQIKTLQEDVLT